MSAEPERPIRDEEELLDALAAEVAGAPDDLLVARQYALLALALGKEPLVRKLLEDWRSKNRAAALYLDANLQAQSGNLEHALASLDAALALSPDSYVLAFARAEVLFALHRYREVIDALDEALIDAPDEDASAPILQCWACFQLKDSEQAIGYAHQALGTLSGLQEPTPRQQLQLAYAWACIANASRMLGNINDAMLAVQQFERLAPVEDPSLIYVNAMVRMDSGQLESALSMTQALLEALPDDRSSAILHAEILDRMGRSGEAVEIRERVREKGWDALRFNLDLTIQVGDLADVSASLVKDDFGLRRQAGISLTMGGLGEPLRELLDTDTDGVQHPNRFSDWLIGSLLLGYVGLASLAGFFGWGDVQAAIRWAPVVLSVSVLLLSVLSSGRYRLMQRMLKAVSASVWALVAAFVAGLFSEARFPVAWYIWLLTLSGWLIAALAAQRYNFRSGRSTGGYLNITALFGSRRRMPETADFRGGNLISIAGKVVLDLTQAGISDRPASVNLSVVFGVIEVRVPRHWIIDVSKLQILGLGMIPHGRLLPGQQPHLVISGTTFFARTKLVQSGEDADADP